MEKELPRDGARDGERPQAPLRLFLLGRFEAVRANAPIASHAWRRRRPADLLKLVALAPGKSLARERAIDTLWPDKDPASGANNLHRALYDLRQILGERWVDIDRGELTLREDVWVDVDAFEGAVARADRDGWTEAVRLYRGDLVPEDRDAAWLEPRRQMLRGRFLDAAFPLARAAAAEGNAQLAIPLLRRVLEVDPAAEEVRRLLMRLLAASGRRAEALREYDACELALRSAGLGPSEETRALRAAIHRGEFASAPAPSSLDGARHAARRLLGTSDPAPVRGRGPMLLLLESLVERGSGAIVLLGERGVGTTRLAVEGARIAQRRGATVLCGIGGVQQGVPYAVFADAFREEARAHPAVPDPFAAAAPARASAIGSEEVRRTIFAGVEAALRAVAGGRPIYLLLDDLHAADESSLNLLHFLARRARELRLMTVATVSEDAIHAGTPIQAALAHLDCARLARGVRVPRLSLSGTRDHVADLCEGAVGEAMVGHVYRVTDGTPLLVEEVVRAQRQSGQAVPDDPAAAIRGRVAGLGQRAGALLAAAAVAGTRFELEPVRIGSGLSAHDAAAALDACVGAKIVHEDAGRYHFHHAVLRDAIYDGLAPDRRASLHAAIADALEALASPHEPPSEAIAFHRRSAGQEERALRHLVAAGHRAASRAGVREALAFYSAALELSARDGVSDASARIELLDAAGRAQLALGEISGAARSFGEASRLAAWEHPDPAVRARARRLAALARASAGQLAEARAEIHEGVSAADDAGGEGLAPLLHLHAQLLWHEGWHEEARAAADACTAAAERCGDLDLVARGRDLAALARAGMGEPLVPPEATDPAERRLQEVSPDHLFDVHLALWDRDLLGDRSAAEIGRAACLLAERARMRDLPEGMAVGRSGEAAAALAAGDADLAEALLREALRGHRAAGSALGEALALERLAALLTARGRIEEARDMIDEGIGVAERGLLRQHALTRLHATAARNRIAAGALQAAEDAVREASESAARHGDCVSCDAAFRPETVRVLLLRGRVEEAEAEAAQLEEIARRRGGRVLGAVAHLTRGRVLASRSSTTDALAELAAARAAFLAAGHRYDAARCARVEVRLRGGAAIPDEVRALDALVVVDSDV